MRLVVGYDRDLATQLFRRNLRELIRPGEDPLVRITTTEVEYFASKLAETSLWSRVDRLGNPWVIRESVEELAELPVKRATRIQLQQFELEANNLLILGGVIGLLGALEAGSREQADFFLKKTKVTKLLFLKASFGTFHSKAEVEVLRLMSWHTEDWFRYLSWLKGHDYRDLLATTPPSERSPLMS